MEDRVNKLLDINLRQQEQIGKLLHEKDHFIKWKKRIQERLQELSESIAEELDYILADAGCSPLQGDTDGK